MSIKTKSRLSVSKNSTRIYQKVANIQFINYKDMRLDDSKFLTESLINYCFG